MKIVLFGFEEFFAQMKGKIITRDQKSFYLSDVFVVIKQLWALIPLLIFLLASFVKAEGVKTLQGERKTSSVNHQSRVEIVDFATWSKIQKTKAQNELARLKNEWILNKKMSEKKSTSLKKRIQMAEEKLAISRDLSFDSYLAIHLSKIENDDLRLIEFASRLSKEQVAHVLKRLKNKNLSQLYYSK